MIFFCPNIKTQQRQNKPCKCDGYNVSHFLLIVLLDPISLHTLCHYSQSL